MRRRAEETVEVGAEAAVGLDEQQPHVVALGDGEVVVARARRDVARAVCFLASDLSAYLTAQTIGVDGGNVLR